MLTVLDLFSGIGGFSLGLERTGGFRTKAFCEIDPFCRQVLAKHWPGIPIHEDVTKLRGENVGPVDVIAGGFPCQDISTAGRGEGIEGSRSGLWKEFARLIGEIRPRYVIVENVSALLARGLDRVLGDLAALGFDAEWHCIPASAVGAPHRRDRIWIVAYPQCAEWRTGEPTGYDANRPSAERQETSSRSGTSGPDGRAPHVADTTIVGRHGEQSEISTEGKQRAAGGCRRQRPLANANPDAAGIGSNIATQLAALERSGYGGLAGQWGVEPDVGRVAHGVPARVDRLRSLGNAVVPQVVEVIGNAILEAA